MEVALFSVDGPPTLFVTLLMCISCGNLNHEYKLFGARCITQLIYVNKSVLGNHYLHSMGATVKF